MNNWKLLAGTGGGRAWKGGRGTAEGDVDTDPSAGAA